MSKNQNHLKNESSPYLLQHAGNPVDWYPWGEEALQLAVSSDKLMIISIGYAACHWCHVMEHESFEDNEVAELMNRFYVSIKVDREERPDIDQIYMTAAQLISGRGGWPLNVIALPDGRPIYAGTYFPKSNWLDVLVKVNQYYRGQREEALKIAENIADGIRQSELIEPVNQTEPFQKDDLIRTFQNWKQTIDYQWGGSDHAPKFPMPAALNFLLKYGKHSSDKDAIYALTLTLDKMAMGGIYDQIGGGFARYSVDRFWLVPHFEKMLYDNSQLISLYADAYRFSQNELYRDVLIETIEFTNRELRSSEGLYFSSLDADSEGLEGKFYVWHQSELDQILGDDSEVISNYYSCKVHGNWEEAQNILHRTSSDAEFIKRNNLDPVQFRKQIDVAKKRLLKERELRIRPGLDDKILTAWNAMMITALVNAYQATENSEYLGNAENSCYELLAELSRSDGGLNRNYKNKNSSINGFLDDYAFTIEALLSLYQVTFKFDYLKRAIELNSYVFKHFFDSDRSFFYYTSDLDPDLIARKMELQDNVIPSSNAVMAHNLRILSELTASDDQHEISVKMAAAMKKHVIEHGQYYAKWADLILSLTDGFYVIVIIGKNYREILSQFQKHYLIDVVFLGGESETELLLLKDKYVEGKTLIYVCQNKSCQLPVETVEAALNLIH